MIIIDALAGSGLEQLADGVWTRHSGFSHAINFCRPDGALLTLFRYGKGIGPAGMLLSRAHFSRLHNVTRLIKRGSILYGPGIILRPRRILRLRLRPAAAALLDLSSCAHQSGLAGPLNQPVTAMPHYRQIMAGLDRWWRGEDPDWRWLIGCGPGLTPSGDDMLAGMLAVLHAANFASSLHQFIPSADQLVLFTTSVSCSYLNSARLGEFSLPVLSVMRRLQSGRDPQHAIRRLLAIGHTSGADTLLGMLLAQRWLQQVDLRRGYARSGNHSYLHSGCGDGKLFPGGQLASQNARGD